MNIKKGGVILVMLLSIGTIQEGSSWSDSVKAVVVVTGEIVPYISISASKDICSWEIKPSGPGIYNKTGIIKLKANVDWQLIAKNGDETTAGHMTDWTGTTYASNKLKTPLKISASREVTLSEGGPIQTGTITEGQDVVVTLTQVVSQDDLPLEDGHVYRIALCFEGSPAN